MKKTILILVCAFFAQLIHGQIGIGTTAPDPSAVLDVSAADKGLLIPRVSLPNVTTTTLDGVNNAATGLLIWNTNASTVGGNGIGLYFYSDASIWESIGSNSANTVVASKIGNSNNFTFIQGTYARLDFDTISFNYGGGSYDPATDLYMVPEDGVYEISVHLNVSFNGTSISEMLLSHRLYVNGSQQTTKILQGGATVNTSFGYTFQVSFIEELSLGDEIGIDILPVWNGVSSSPTVFGGSNPGGNGTHLLIKKIN
ncbi:MAG: hypothetical protein AAFP76_03340 [Bacteroidota bacterium]